MENPDYNNYYKRPKRAIEYYALLYCKRKKIKFGHKNILEAKRSWRSLTSDEQQIFIDKYNKWQAENDKRLGNVLQCAEPFMKKRKTAKEKINIDTRLTDVKEKSDYDDNEPMIKNLPQNTDDADSKSTNQEKISVDTHLTEVTEKYDYDDNEPITENHPQHIDDNISNAESESTNHVYAASVIDRGLDESISHQEINYTVQIEQLTEPVPPTIQGSRELFETLKSSGARPELADVEWKELTKQEKGLYLQAIIHMKKQYLLKLEHYLESLSSPELFKYYIKTLNK